MNYTAAVTVQRCHSIRRTRNLEEHCHELATAKDVVDLTPDGTLFQARVAVMHWKCPVAWWTRSALDRAHLPPTTVFRRLKTTRYCFDRLPIPVRAWDFPDVIKFHVAVRTLREKAIRFLHPDYDSDQAQKLISSSMSRHLSTRNILSKSIHAFLSNLAHRQTDQRGRVMGENIGLFLLRCRRCMIGLPYGEKSRIWQYVKPFSSNTGTWRTDGQTDLL